MRIRSEPSKQPTENSCDICSLKENVESVQIPIVTFSANKMIRAENYRKSNLCKKCKAKNIFLLNKTTSYGKLTYVQNIGNGNTVVLKII